MKEVKPTPSQVADCNDMQQLCDWAAVYCMRWHKDEGRLIYDVAGKPGFDYCTSDGERVMYERDWQPTSPTHQGKAQCFDLMVNFNITREYEDYDLLGFHYTSNYKKSGGFTPHIWEWEDGVEQDPQVCMVKTAIISVIDDSDDSDE